MIKNIFTLLTIVAGITISSSIFAQENIPKAPPTKPPTQFNIAKMTLPPGLQITVGRPMFCSNTETFLQNIGNKYGEKSIFIGVVEEASDLLFDVLYNKDSKSFTMVQHFAVGNSCVLAAGKAVNVDLTADKAGYLINYKK